MKTLLVTLALLSPADGGSLGIGIDVLPEAFSFAARRAGLSAILVLKTCTESRCSWDLGEGLSIVADRPRESLDITRIEATLAPASATLKPSADRYERACLAIVALVDRGTSPADQQLEAKAIASPAVAAPRDVRFRLADRPVRLYGAIAADDRDTQPVVKRCGAVAA